MLFLAKLLRSDWLNDEGGVGWRDMEADRTLYTQIADCQQAVHEGMCENFNTSKVIRCMIALVETCDAYMRRPPPAAPAVYLLKKAGMYLTSILRVLGVVEGADDIGFPVSGGNSSAVDGMLDTLNEFRDTVRSIALKKGSADAVSAACDGVDSALAAQGEEATVSLPEQVAGVLKQFAGLIRKSAGAPADILKACDVIRDDTLPEIGVRLTDGTREGESAKWQLDDPATLKKEVAEQRAAVAAKAAQAAAKKAAKGNKELDRMKKAGTPASELLAADLKKAKVDFVALEAWEKLQPPPTEKGPDGKPTDAWKKKKEAATAGQVRSHGLQPQLRWTIPTAAVS